MNVNNSESFDHKLIFLRNCVRAVFCLFTLLLLVYSFGNVSAQTKTRLSYLQSGLKLRYDFMDVRANPSFGTGGDFTRRGNLTINVLRVDSMTGWIQLQYNVSSVVAFPPPTSSGILMAVNVDGSKSNFKWADTLPVPPYVRTWSIHSLVTLDGRNTIKIEGERADVVIEYSGGKVLGGHNAWGVYSTDFLIGSPTGLFIDPATKEGDIVHTYILSVHGQPTVNPTITDLSLSCTSTREFAFPLGHRPALVLEAKYGPGEIQGTWHTYETDYYDKESGILLSKDVSGIVTDNEDGYVQNAAYHIRLVEVTPFNTTISLNQVPKEVGPGSPISISGWITPPVEGASLKIILSAGVSFARDALTGNDGKFNSTIPIQSESRWDIRVEYSGNLFAKPSHYETSLMVIRGYQDSAEQRSQTQFRNGIWWLIILGIALIIGFIMILLYRKRAVSRPTKDARTSAGIRGTSQDAAFY